MPPKSKAMRRTAAIAEKVKKGEAPATPGMPSTKMAKSMSSKQLHEFASGPEKGLPMHAKGGKKKKKKGEL